MKQAVKLEVNLKGKINVLFVQKSGGGERKNKILIARLHKNQLSVVFYVLDSRNNLWI